MNYSDNDIKYLRARDTVKRIRGFYLHLFVFSIVMLAAVVLPSFDAFFCFICFTKDRWLNLLGFTPWFLGLFIHGLYALGMIKAIRKWEEKKLKQFLEE